MSSQNLLARSKMSFHAIVIPLSRPLSLYTQSRSEESDNGIEAVDSSQRRPVFVGYESKI